MSSSKITISTRRYRHIHGHRPNGLGLWYFQLPGGRVFAYAGGYTIACRAAADHARQSRLGARMSIQVCA